MPGAPPKELYHCFFGKAPKISWINEYQRRSMGKQWKSKIKKLASGHFTFWKCYVQGPPRKRQYHHFFGGVLNVSRIIDFYTCNLDKDKTKKETNFIFCSIFKVVFRGCPKRELMSLLYIIFRIIDFYTSNFGK